MLELSLCGAIADVVERARAGRPVTTVHLRIGRLRQVVPDTLTYCWGLVTAGGPLGGSRLDIDEVPVVLACRPCGASTEVADVLVLACGVCGSVDVEVSEGEDFLVTSIDLGVAPGLSEGMAPGESASKATSEREN